MALPTSGAHRRALDRAAYLLLIFALLALCGEGHAANGKSALAGTTLPAK
jgi:hypothetical protein